MEQLSQLEWHCVFVRLCPNDLCNVIQTCKRFQQLADNDVVWSALAVKRWGAADGQLGSYCSHKGLVLDDNRQNLACALPLSPGKACRWRFQQWRRYYVCRLLHLEWWRSDGSLRLYFDARGESDLRLPLTSSLAVVQLNPAQPAAAAAAAPAGSSAAPALQGEGGDPAVAAAAAAGRGTADNDADSDDSMWSPTSSCRLCLSHLPDSCHSVACRNGHFKGVMIWQSDKCRQILQELFVDETQQPAAPTSSALQPPAPQHSHQHCGRRSQAWEEWADWQLDQDQEALEEGEGIIPGAWFGEAAGSSPGDRGGGSEPSHQPPCLPRLSALFSSCGGASSGDASSGNGSSGNGSSSSSNPRAAGVSSSSSCRVDAGAASAAGTVLQGGAGSSGAPLAKGLVFCYANNLQEFFHVNHSWYSPDYSTALLFKASPPSPPLMPTAVTAMSPPLSTGPAIHSSSQHSSRLGQPGQSFRYHRHPQRPSHLASVSEVAAPPQQGHVDLLPAHLEWRWVRQWMKLPGAVLQPLRRFEQQLRGEGEAAERARWDDLPDAVKQRGASWWV